MRPRLFVLTLLTLAFGFPGFAAPASAVDRLPGPVSGQVIKVIDGDTLEVRVMVWLGQEVVTRVRVDGIDTPERRGKCQNEKDLAEQAQRLTEELVSEADIWLHDVQHDKYGGRVRARVVTRSGQDLGQQLIKAGLARSYQGNARQSWCLVAQLP